MLLSLKLELGVCTFSYNIFHISPLFFQKKPSISYEIRLITCSNKGNYEGTTRGDADLEKNKKVSFICVNGQNSSALK